MNLLNKPPMGLKPDKPTSSEVQAGKAWMGRVKQLPCVICHEWGMHQNSPTEVHHIKSGRYGNRREVDTMTIPLCHSHHNKLRPYPGDEGKIGFHNAQETWEAAYGPDHDWLSWVEVHLNKDNHED